MRAAFLLALTALGLSGCTLSLGGAECSVDADCPSLSGKKQFCTRDRLCTIGTPVEKMCNQVHPRSPAQNAVPLGALLTLPTDDLSLKALQLGVDEINALAGSGQRPLVLYTCNVAGGEDDPPKALKHLWRERGVVAVIGPTSSGDVISVASIAGEAQVPLVSPSATAPAISNLPQRGAYTFRVAPSDELQGKVLASQVKKANSPPASRLALLFVDDAYGKGLQESFVREWGKVPEVIRSFQEEDAAAVNAAGDAAIMAAGLTDVVAITYLDTAALVTRLEPLDLRVRIWMADGAKNQGLLGLVDKVSETHLDRVRGTAPTVLTSSPFQTAFKAKFGIDPSSDAFSAYSYDALYAIAIALGNGRGSPTGPLVSQGLRRIAGPDPPTPVGQTSYLDAVRRMSEGKQVPLQGASGVIRFNDRGDRLEALFEQWSVNQNARPPVFVSTPLPAIM